MIVRNEDMNLSSCLESVRGVFDEIVVVDTGSTDRTREIACAFGAQVFEFAWVDDFAAARNVALSHATGDYAFWVDADDVLDPPEREKLRALMRRQEWQREEARRDLEERAQHVRQWRQSLEDGEAAVPPAARPPADLEKKLDQVLRELAELRRTLRRPAEDRPEKP